MKFLIQYKKLNFLNFLSETLIYWKHATLYVRTWNHLGVSMVKSCLLVCEG